MSKTIIAVGNIEIEKFKFHDTDIYMVFSGEKNCKFIYWFLQRC